MCAFSRPALPLLVVAALVVAASSLAPAAEPATAPVAESADNGDQRAVGPVKRVLDELEKSARPYEPDRIHVLAIGIDRYSKWSNLNCSVADARTFAHTITRVCGVPVDNVKMLTDEEATRVNVMQAVSSYRIGERKLGDRDSLIIYYAGHGCRDGDGNSYWVPTDAPRGDMATIAPHLLSSAQLFKEDFEKYRVHHLLVLVDSCFGGLALMRDGAPERAASLPAGWLESSRWVITSGADEPVPDGSTHSPFNASLVKCLDSLNQPFDVHDVFSKVKSSHGTTAILAGLDTPRHRPHGTFLFVPRERTGRTGHVRLVSHLSGELLVNEAQGEKRGVAAGMTYDLPYLSEGIHLLWIINEQGQELWKQSVTVRDGKTTEVIARAAGIHERYLNANAFLQAARKEQESAQRDLLLKAYAELVRAGAVQGAEGDREKLKGEIARELLAPLQELLRQGNNRQMLRTKELPGLNSLERMLTAAPPKREEAQKAEADVREALAAVYGELAKRAREALEAREEDLKQAEPKVREQVAVLRQQARTAVGLGNFTEAGRCFWTAWDLIPRQCRDLLNELERLAAEADQVNNLAWLLGQDPMKMSDVMKDAAGMAGDAVEKAGGAAATCGSDAAFLARREALKDKMVALKERLSTPAVLEAIPQFVKDYRLVEDNRLAGNSPVANVRMAIGHLNEPRGQVLPAAVRRRLQGALCCVVVRHYLGRGTVADRRYLRSWALQALREMDCGLGGLSKHEEGSNLSAQLMAAVLPPGLTIVEPPDERAGNPHCRLFPRVVRNALEMEFVLVPPGEFVAGSFEPRDYKWNKPPHPVTLNRPYYLGRFEVSVGEYRQFCHQAFPGRDKDLPVTCLRYEEVMRFINWLNTTAGLPITAKVPAVGAAEGQPQNWRIDGQVEGYRLPTEAEWEFACRFGMDQVAEAELRACAWVNRVADGQLARSGLLTAGSRVSAHKLGQYLMLGNVAELVADWFAPYGAGGMTDPQAQFSLAGLPNGMEPQLVARGGDLGPRCGALADLATYRQLLSPDSKLPPTVGFRLVVPMAVDIE